MKRKAITKLVVMFIAVLVLGMVTTTTVFADETTSAYVTSDTEVLRGQEITFTVGIDNGTGIQAIMIVPDYDSNAFELVSGNWTLTGGLMSDFSVSTGDGVIAFNSGISIDGAVLNFTLKAKDNAVLETQNVSAEVIITDSNGNSTLTTSGSSVQIKCNHDYSKQDFTYIKSEATCTSPAIYYKSCVGCGEKGTETFESGTTVEHSYTRQETTDAYLKSNASCTATAVYYYCCATCDSKGTTTYEYGTTLAHSYSKQVITDTYKVSDADCDSKAVYNYCCATCEAKSTTTFEYGDVLGHTGGTATCTTKAECTRCYQEYGNTLEHVYTDEDATATYLKSAATCTSAAMYYKNCATCDKAGTATFEYGTTEPHAYTRQVKSDTYMKTSASCTTVAVYYYCCATCDSKGTTTYEYGTTLAHSYSKQVITDTYKVSDADCDSKAVYNYCCATCDAKGAATFEYGDVLGHTGGTATCTTKAECTRCYQEYGNTLEHVYTDEDATVAYLKSAATCTNKAIYYKNCVTCDKAGTLTFEYGEKAAHTYVEKISGTYLKSPESCTAKAIYYKSCSACGIKGTETFEVGEAPSHNYQTNWTCDNVSHWHECSKCGDKKDSASHTAGAAATETTAQRCTVCDYIITPALGHTHNYSSEWASDANGHWHSCIGCNEKKDIAEHVFETDCDTDCATCGYVRITTHTYKSDWSSNDEMHWHECSTCGAKTDEEAHIEGAEATETTDQTCTICGYVIKTALGHTHDHNTIKKDETNHWNECACGDKTDVVVHAWDDGVVTKEATYDAEGEKTFTCSICSHTKVESIEKLIREDDTTTDIDVDTNTDVDTDAETDADTDADTDATEQPSSGCRSAVGVGVASVVVIAIVCGTAIFLKKKKA